MRLSKKGENLFELKNAGALYVVLLESYFNKWDWAQTPPIKNGFFEKPFVKIQA